MPEEKKIDRRKYIKYVGAGAVVAAAAAAIGYGVSELTKPPPPTPTTVVTTVPTVRTETLPGTTIVRTEEKTVVQTVTPTPTTRKLVVWWTVEYSPVEKATLLELIRKFEKETGISIEWTGYSSTDISRKLTAGIEAGVVPDITEVLSHEMCHLAYRGLLEDVSDIMDEIKGDLLSAALESVYLYNSKTGKRSYYAIPLNFYATYMHYWKDLLKKAGYDEPPTDWNGFWEAFKKAQDATGVPAIGWTLSDRAEFDTAWPWEVLMLAYDVRLLTPDGKLNITEENRKRMIDALEWLSNLYFSGYMPSGVIEWGDPDNNKAFQGKSIIMTMNGTLSIPRWLYENARDAYYNLTATCPWPNGPTGKETPTSYTIYPVIIPKGAKNVEEAKEFLKFLCKPENYLLYTKSMLGRFHPMYKSALEDPYFNDPKDPHITAATKYFKRSMVPVNWQMHPAYAKFVIEHKWHRMIGRVVVEKWTAEKAVDEALNDLKKTFEEFA
jgi:multiple sugar transport system substrate-binding protein